MRRFTAIILGISFVVGAAVFGNYFYRSRMQDNTIRVVGAATKRFESDIVKWRISVGRNTGLGDASAGYSDTRKAFESLMAELKGAGISDQEISVQPINRNPVYDNNGNLTGYSFSQSVYVISSDLATVEKLALNPDQMYQKDVALQSSLLEYYFSKLPDIKKELLAEARRRRPATRSSGRLRSPRTLAPASARCARPGPASSRLPNRTQPKSRTTVSTTPRPARRM